MIGKDLPIPCFIDWLKTAYGITALIVSLVVGFVGAYLMDER